MTERRSPIEILIDQACERDREPREFDARRVAEDVIGHIDAMYPDMWKPVSKSARLSIRNTVINSINAELERVKRAGQ